MAWLYIVLAGSLEILWPFVLKRFSDYPFAPAIIAIITSVPIFYLLSLAMKSLPTGTTYIAFVSIGSVGVALTGILLFHESTNVFRMVSLVLAISGALGLKYFGASR